MRASSLPLRHRVGQLLILGFDGPEFSPTLSRLLTSMQPGGLILFARNITSPQQCFGLLNQCQGAVRVPLFRCVDLEGGTVDRLRKIIAPAPSAADVVRTGSEKLFEEHGRIIGQEVRACGFNVDFAPVLDLDLSPSRTVLGSRTVSSDPGMVVRYARKFLKGLRSSKVLGCGKHFPGLGAASLDTHKELPTICRSWDELCSADLRPYRELRQDIAFVMVAHAAYPEAIKGTDGNLPASLSSEWITGILKKKTGYRGLIISDDLEMGGVLAAATIEHAAVETLRAGADIFLLCRNEDLLWRAYESVLQQAERDRRFAAVVDHAADRVLRFKRSSQAIRRTATRGPLPAEVEKLAGKLHTFAEEVQKKSCVVSA